MLRGASLVWVVSMAVLTTCLARTPATPTGEEPDSPWLPFLPWDSHTALSHPPTHPQQDTNTRTKRVFLSRGWGPGGYDAPPPPASQRYMRRPLVPSSLGQVNTERPFPSPLALRERAGRARFAALVSTQRQETQQQPQYRRFHSIFTSGTWSPLGKRSTPMDDADLFPGMEEEHDDNTDKFPLLFSKTKPFVKDKRVGVFASHGWGAGGSPSPTWTSSSPTTRWTDAQHPWLALPLIASDNTSSSSSGGGGGGGGGDRYMASFRSGGPLLHHFLSHGWQPMGR